MKSHALYKSDKKWVKETLKIGEELYLTKDDTQGDVCIDREDDTHGGVDKMQGKSTEDGMKKNPCAIWLF